MTKKDYEALAQVIRWQWNLADANENGDALDAVERIANGMATVMEQDNPRFSRQRFLAACRGEKWTAKRDGKHRNSWQTGETHGEVIR